MNSPSPKTVKQLFALSKNQCAFPKCNVPIVVEENNTVVGEVCHIRGRRPGSARYDPSQPDDERNVFSNLILMCSLHHKVIDEDDESYSVERLIEIKTTHEASNAKTLRSDEDRSQFNRLLEERIRLIIEHEKAKPDDGAEANQASGPFALAQQMADERRFEEKRACLFSSYQGVEQTIDSVDAILGGIGRRFSEETEDLSISGIGLHSERKLRVVSTDEFGCKVLLEGFDGANHYRIPESLRLEIVLFGKRPTRQAPDTFYANPITRITLKPDFTERLETVWVDEKKVVYSIDAVINKVFDLLLQQIEKEKNRRDFVGRSIQKG